MADSGVGALKSLVKRALLAKSAVSFVRDLAEVASSMVVSGGRRYGRVSVVIACRVAFVPIVKKCIVAVLTQENKIVLCYFFLSYHKRR